MTLVGIEPTDVCGSRGHQFLVRRNAVRCLRRQWRRIMVSQPLRYENSPGQRWTIAELSQTSQCMLQWSMTHSCAS